MLRSKILCPPNVGTSSDLPDDLVRVAHLERTNVVAWATVDEEFEDKIWMATCCQHFGVFFFLPCFWPHLIVLSPCLLTRKISADDTIQNTFWVLTTTEVKVIMVSHEHICCYTKGAQVKSIPLDSITDCGISAPDTGCGDCVTTVPTIYIDTASSSARSSNDAGGHEEVGYGFSGYDWFASEICARRDKLRGQNQHIPVAYAEMDRGDQIEPVSTIEDRLQKIRDLHNGGLVTDVEYEKKRQDIIASI